jgi:hypothetical protein
MDPEIREKIARSIHESYRDKHSSDADNEDPSMAEWDKLPENLKESNRQQAEDISNKLSRIGYVAYQVASHPLSLKVFTDEEIETMAEMEHTRWNDERFRDGWKLGKIKDVTNKISPYLVPWAELPENVKEWDRETVRNIPELLAKVGLGVRRQA